MRLASYANRQGKGRRSTEVIMLRKAFYTAGLTLALATAAMADTPIGPGVSGSGGTGANTADSKVRAGAGGEAPVVRQDGMPADRADSNARTKARAPVGAGDNAPATGATGSPPPNASTGK